MVATRLYEVTAKGTEWAYGGTSATSAAAGGGGASRSGYETPLVPSSPSLSPPASPLPRWNSSSSTTSAHGGGGSSYYWRYAHDSIHTAADATYSAVASLLSSLYSGNNASRGGSAYYHDGDNDNYDQDGRIRTQSHHTMDSWMGGGGGDDLSASLRGTAASTAGTRRMVTPFTLNSSDLAMLLFKNPYNGVRGRHRQPHQPASITAVRALLTLVVPAVDIGEHDDEIRSRLPTLDNDNDGEDDAPLRRGSSSAADWATSASASGPYPASGHAAADDTSSHGRDPFSVAAASSHAPSSHRHHHHHGLRVSPSETASQIAEGTIRALRDLVCDEAVDLQIALRFWTERWERPLFSWIEAGPEVWLSPGGYNHQLVGKKVAQIQAVLARRCATIGELQQHLLRAGWQRGVAQWGVLGHGGEWAAVAGFDGTIPDETGNHSYVRRELRRNIANEATPDASASKTMPPRPVPQREGLFRQMSSQSAVAGAANALVERERGGGLFVDDPAFLTEWSVQAIDLVRRTLKAASGGRVPIPHDENWSHYFSKGGDHQGQLIVDAGDGAVTSLPLWVGEAPFRKADLTESEHSTASLEQRPGLVVTDLPLLIEEVSDLLNVMEDILALQRRRRLAKFRPPPWLRRNWYVVTTLAPPISYILYKITRRETISLVVQKIRDFFRDHLREPLVAIFNEIWKGRESFSDKEARREAMESLKKMIRSWLDDTFPTMPEAKRIELSNAMDVTLIEQQKVESMKTFFEINNVIRMSFIEMQYMKKELLNALSAIDEMMSANDINMNVAAITPVLMLIYGTTRVFRFLYYALLKLGKSREETYESFRSILTDIERLLVMRDDPPIPSISALERQNRDAAITKSPVSQELCADDLGMIMLLIHECRSILWRDGRRFSNDTIRSVHEDLAELAGERGAVSVRQQVQIIERMSRTYQFLQIRLI